MLVVMSSMLAVMCNAIWIRVDDAIFKGKWSKHELEIFEWHNRIREEPITIVAEL